MVINYSESIKKFGKMELDVFHLMFASGYADSQRKIDEWHRRNRSHKLYACKDVIPHLHLILYHGGIEPRHRMFLLDFVLLFHMRQFTGGMHALDAFARSGSQEYYDGTESAQYWLDRNVLRGSLTPGRFLMLNNDPTSWNLPLPTLRAMQTYIDCRTMQGRID